MEGAGPDEYRVRLLADEPADIDEFDARAHARVADAIAGLIKAGDGGKVIGLEGEWGSGKSTIVRFVRQNLSRASGESTRVVLFDAWAHQGDPLRRTFLESLIREVHEAEWISDEVASSALDELTGRTSHITTSSTSRLSTEGKLAAGATVLLALGAALFGNHFSHYHRPLIFAGAILLVAPLIVVSLLWVARALGRRLRSEGYRDVWSRLGELNPGSFFAKDQRTETVTTGIQHADPTSVEFERVFSHVLNTALTDGRQVVIVLDNLDRVDEADARTVLGTMQTFMATTHTSSRWASNVWTLIPYDTDGLEKLWLSEDQGEAQEADGASVARPHLSVASAFLDKLFQVRFEAPPLVLSDWRGYTRRLLEEAFPDEKSETVEGVLRLRGLYPGAVPKGAVADEAPTPRQLKQFVNQIGAIRRQRDDVPLVHVAYYVLLRRDSIDPQQELIGRGIPHTKLAHLFEGDIRDDIAALHFGADRVLAQQLLFGPALEAAFSAGDPEVVRALSDRAGFVDALDVLDFEARAGAGGVELTRAAATLGRSGALGVEQVKSWAAAVLDPLAAQTTPWRLQGRETGEGLALLLNRVTANDDARLTELLSRVAPAPLDSDTDGQGQLQGVAGLLDSLMSLGRAGDAVRVRIDIPTARFVDSLAFLCEEVRQERASRLLELATSPSQVADALVEGATTSNRITEARTALEFLLVRPERVALGELAAKSIEWLRANEPASPEQLTLLLDWMDRARRALDAENVLGAAADDGTLLHLMAVATANSWFSEAATASMLHLVARPELPEVPTPSRQSPAGLASLRQILAGVSPDEIVKEQLAWLAAHRREAFDIVARVSKAPDAQPWVDQQMRALADDEALVTGSGQYVANWGYLRKVLGTERFTRHTRQLLDKEKDRAKILAALTDPQRGLDVLDGAESGDVAPYLEAVKKAAAEVVEKASADDWETALSTSSGTSSLLQLALRLAGSTAAPKNPNGLQDALHVHFQALAAGEDAWSTDGEEFAKLATLLVASSRRVLASQLCAELEGRDGQVGPTLFPTYGVFLGSEAAFRTHPKLPNVIERLVAREDWPDLGWFVQLARRESDALTDAGRQDEMEHLRDTVREKLRVLGEEAPEELTSLGSLFNIEPEPPARQPEPKE